MDLRSIRELVKIMENSSLTELEFKGPDFELSLSRKTQGAELIQGYVPPAAEAPAKKESAEEDETILITSPIVGTFYSAAAPDVPAFVKVGDHVKKGQTICILEAMKVMNNIDVDYDCEIEAILVSNEQKVEYGQPLFRVRRT